MIRSAEKRNTRDYFPKSTAVYLAWRVTNDFVREYQKKKNQHKIKTKEKQGKERKEKKKKQL